MVAAVLRKLHGSSTNSQDRLVLRTRLVSLHLRDASVLQLADHRVLGEVSGELSPASVYVGLLPVVEAFVVVAVPWRVGSGFPPTSRRPSILTGLGSG